jgi:prepilin-type N-terminal cleavage/methylation domain-containing protein
MLKLNNKGFSLIEAMIAIAILAIAITGLVVTQGTFARQTVDRTLLNSLLDAASNALTQCEAVRFTPNNLTFTYENNLIVDVSLSGTCNPVNTCSPVTATAAAKGKKVELTTQVCVYD